MPKPTKKLEEVIEEQTTGATTDLNAAKLVAELTFRLKRYPVSHFERIKELAEVHGYDQLADETDVLIQAHNSLRTIAEFHNPEPPPEEDPAPAEPPTDENVGKTVDISAARPVQPHDAPVEVEPVQQLDTELKGPKPPK